MTPVIRTIGLTRRFGDVLAVDGLDLAVPTGVVSGFLGPNGAGKTTSLRMVLGLIRPDAGEVELFGTPLMERREALLGRVGALVERPSLYDHLTGRENLEVTRRILGAASSQVDRVLAIVRLEDAAHRRVGEYSQGMRQRLGLALAMLGEPELLILDEPTNGLDPAGIQEMRDLLRRLPQDEGVSVFLSSHLLAEVEQVASHLVILHRRRCLFQGSPEDLQNGGIEGRQGAVVVGVERPREAATVLTEAGWPSEVVVEGGGSEVATGSPQESLHVEAVGVRHAPRSVALWSMQATRSTTLTRHRRRLNPSFSTLPKTRWQKTRREVHDERIPRCSASRNPQAPADWMAGRSFVSRDVL